MKIIVRNRCELVGPISSELEAKIKSIFTHKNVKYQREIAMGFTWTKTPQFICSWTKTPNGMSVPRGSLQTLIDLIVQNDFAFEVEVEDARTFKPIEPLMFGVELWDFQEDMVEKTIVNVIQSQSGCGLWRSPCASGKTTSALAFAARIKQRTLVLVNTRSLLDQWVKRVETSFGFKPDVLGGGKKKLGKSPIVIGMNQTVVNMIDQMRDLFGCVICDEVQGFAADSFQEVIDQFSAAYRLGVSADERRSDGKQTLIYEQFGKVTHVIEKQSMVEKGFVLDVEIRVLPCDIKVDWWDQLQNLKQRDGETENELRTRIIRHKVQMNTKLLDELGANETRFNMAMDCVANTVSESDHIMVLANRRDHCFKFQSSAVERGLKPGLLIGSAENRDEFQLTLKRFNAKECNVAIGTYQAIGVGFDLPIVSRGLFATPAANSTTGEYQWNQYRGRFARSAKDLGKTNAIIYYIWDRNVFGVNPMKNLLRWNEKVSILVNGEWVALSIFLKTYVDTRKMRVVEGDDNGIKKIGTSQTRKRSDVIRRV